MLWCIAWMHWDECMWYYGELMTEMMNWWQFRNHFRGFYECRIVMIKWLLEMLYWRARWYEWYACEVRVSKPSFNCINDMTIPCNVSMIMLAWSTWALRTLKWLTFEVFELYKFWKCFSDGCSNKIVYASIPCITIRFIKSF